MPRQLTQKLEDRKEREYRRTISWYHSITKWLINRTNGEPHAVLELIRDAADERHRRLGAKVEDYEDVNDTSN